MHRRDGADADPGAPPPASRIPGRGAPTPSVLKATTILGALARGGGTASLSALARDTGQAKSTTHRVLAQLIDAGLVERDEGAYSLGPALLEIAAQAAGGRYGVVTNTATPHMTELHDRTACTVHLATLSGTDVIYLQKIHGRDGTRTPTGMGVRLPAHCTAIGKALLGEDPSGSLAALHGGPIRQMTRFSHRSPSTLERDLTAIGDRGYAVSDEEACLGLACVGATVRDARGVAVAALSLSLPRARFDERRLTAIVLRAAAAIGDDLRAAERVEPSPSRHPAAPPSASATSISMSS